MLLTSTDISSEVIMKAALGTTGSAISAAEVLTQASQEIVHFVLPELIKCQEGYLLYADTMPLTAGQSRYRIPYRSVMSKIRHIYGTRADGTRMDFDEIRVEQIAQYQTTATAEQPKFCIMGNNIEFFPTPSTSATLNLIYPFRPNTLVPNIQGATITAIDTGTGQITVGTMPTGITSGVVLDFVNNLSGNEIVYYDITADTVAGNVIEVSDNISNLMVGQYVTLATKTIIPMVPEEMHMYLVEATVARVERIRGNDIRQKEAASDLRDLRETIKTLLQYRVDSKPTMLGGPSVFMRGGRW